MTDYRDHLKIVDEIMSKTKEDETILQDAETANKVFQEMKALDALGWTYETNGYIEDSYTMYEFALRILERYAKFTHAERVTHHMAICYLALARVDIARQNLDSFKNNYDAFIKNSLLVIAQANEEQLQHSEVIYLAKHTETIIKKLHQDMDEFIDFFIQNSILAYNIMYEQNVLSKVLYDQLMLYIVYAQILFHRKDTAETYNLHIEIIESMIEEFGLDYVMDDVYDQIDKLVYSPNTPLEYKETYLSYKEAYLSPDILQDNTIRIFISSTFLDFQFERDILQTEVYNQLSQYCMSTYQKDLDIVDLRWGITIDEHNSEEEAIYKTLLICEENIKHADPYFLLFIGDKYGTEVSKSIIDMIYPNLQANRDLSITEIEYLLRQKEIEDSDHILLFNRLSNQEQVDTNVQSLLDTVYNELPSENITEYLTGEVSDANYRESLANLLFQKLKTLIDRNTKPTEVYDPGTYHMLTLANKMVGFKEERKLFDTLFFRLSKPIILVAGDKGSGKTTFLGHLYNYLTNENGYPVYTLHPKYLDTVMDNNTFIANVLSIVANYLQFEIPDTIQNAESMLELLQLLLNNAQLERDIVILIDDFDTLQSYFRPFDWFNRQRYPNLRFLVGVSNSLDILEYATQEGYPIQLNPIMQDLPKYVHQKLAAHHKHIDPDILHRINLKFTTNDLEANPLYATLLLQELIYIGADNFEEIKQFNHNDIGFTNAMTNYQRYLIQEFPLSIKDYLKKNIQKLIEESPIYESVFSLLAYRQSLGVTVEDVQAFIKDNELPSEFNSFLDLSYKFSEFLQFHSFNHITLRDRMMTEIIFETVSDYVLRLAGYYVILDIEKLNYSNYSQYMNVLLYMEDFDEIVSIYGHSHFIIQSMTIYGIITHPFSNDVDIKLLKNMTLNKSAVGLIMGLIDNDIHSNNQTMENKRITYCETIIERTKAMEEPNEDIMTALLFAYEHFLRYKHNRKQLTEENITEAVNTWVMYQDKIEYQSNYQIRYLKTLTQVLASRPNRINDIYRLIDLVNEQHLQLQYADTMFEFFMFQQYTLIAQKDGDPSVLDNMYNTYQQYYTEQNLFKPNDQIELLFFMADMYDLIGEKEKSLNIHIELVTIFEREDFLLQYNFKHTKIKSTSMNNIGVRHYSILVQMLIQNREYFDTPDEELTSYMEQAELTLQQAAILSQSIRNVEQSTRTLINYHISSTNYAIYLLVFTTKKEDAYGFLQSDFTSLGEALQEGQDVIERYLISLVYMSIIESHFKVYLLDIDKAFTFFKNNYTKVTETLSKYDLDFILKSGDDLCMILGIEKPSSYQELEQDIITILSSSNRSH
jgi:hypothetical protein